MDYVALIIFARHIWRPFIIFARQIWARFSCFRRNVAERRKHGPRLKKAHIEPVILHPGDALTRKHRNIASPKYM